MNKNIILSLLIVCIPSYACGMDEKPSEIPYIQTSPKKVRFLEPFPSYTAEKSEQLSLAEYHSGMMPHTSPCLMITAGLLQACAATLIYTYIQYTT